MSGTGKTTKSISQTGNQLIDGILSNRAWGDSSIYYSFPTSSSEYGYTGEPSTFVRITSAAQMTATHFALNTAYGGSASAGFSVEGFTNLNIVYTASTNAHIRLAESSSPSTAWAYYPSTWSKGGDVWFNTGSYRSPQAGNYAWHTHLHEIGHALGLKHGHETDIFGASPIQYDSMEYSIMTYRSYVGHDLNTYGYYTNETWGYAQTYMMADIAALQHMYGADFTTNSGNTIYRWDPNSGDTWINGSIAIDAGGNRIFATIWDGGGIDTYDLSAYSSNLSIDLRPGYHSLFSSTQRANLGNNNYARGNIFNAIMYNNDPRSLIENVIGGSGNDLIIGNSADNTIRGGGGNDTIRSGGGNDTIYGGGGIDWFDGQGGWDTANYTDRSGINWTFDLTAAYYSGGLYWNTATATGAISGTEYFRNIEQIIAGDGSDWFYGNSDSNEFWGGDGSDHFQAGGGTDYIYGGLGTDFGHFTGNYSAYTVVSVDQGSGQVIVNGPEGYDTFLGVEWFQFADQTIWWQNLGQTGGSGAVANDFNGDGRSDILWRHSTGAVVNWLINASGTGLQSSAYLGGDQSWQIAGTGDFNGDKRSDILWRHSSGAVVTWLMNASGTGLQSSAYLGGDQSWQIAGTGDFNGDKRSDILWRHSSGAVITWLMNASGTGLQSSAYLGGDQSWQIAGTGDFNGDKRSDILWRHSSGGVVNWLMNASGTGLQSSAYLGGDQSWQIAGTGDFNGDKRSDILWRHSSGAVVNWLMNASGTGLQSSAYLGGDQSWTIA